MITVAPGIYRRTEVDYDAIDAVNQSTLKAIAKSPKHYRHRLDHGVEPTDTMRLGTLAHTLLLEPERFDQDFALYAPVNRTDRFASKLFDLFCAENEGKTVIKRADLEAAKRIRDAVMAHKVARKYLQRGLAEVILVWRDEPTGLLCKGRLDWLSKAIPGTDIMVDVKTARDVSQWAFESAFAKREYDVQTAFYCDGYQTITGRALYPKAVAVENVEPHDVVVYDLLEVLETGRSIYRDMITLLADCRKSGQWPGQAEQAERVLNLPKWRNPSEDEGIEGVDLDWGSAHG